MPTSGMEASMYNQVSKRVTQILPDYYETEIASPAQVKDLKQFMSQWFTNIKNQVSLRNICRYSS